MSSSSDDELFLIESVALKLLRKRQRAHEINLERRELGEYHHLFPQLKTDKDRFFAYVRMELSTFNYILSKVEGLLTKNWGNWHKQPIYPEERLVICLRYLATGSSFKTLSFSFRVGTSTVCNIVREVVRAIWNTLYPLHMPVPTKDLFLEIATDCFSLWNFPNCLGCLDGKHVRIKCPAQSGSMFYNYKQVFSTVLQGVADAHYRFVVIDVGGCGKQNDGSTFASSDLFKIMQKHKLDIPNPTFLPGTNVKAPYVFVGDDAYPLMTNLLKPFSRNNLSFDEEMYNKRLSRMRKSIECAFGILFAKWRLLSTSIDTQINVAEDIIKCICLLHNTIIDKEGMQHNLMETEVNPVPKTKAKPLGRPTNSAINIRDLFKTYFANNPLVFTE